MDRIVDSHHHIWRRQDLPWLEGPMLPRIFGPYEPIRRDYAIEEYLGDIEGSGIAQSIYVQANWAPARAVDEVAWVQAEADRTGYPHAIVGYADLRDPNVGNVLKAQCQYPLLRGIRMQLHWHENEQYRFADGPAVMNDAALRRTSRCWRSTVSSSSFKSSPRRWRTAPPSPRRFPTCRWCSPTAGCPRT